MPEKHTYEFVKEQFEKIGYTLLSTEYKNNRSELNYICDKGHKEYTTYYNFNRSRNCLTCSKKKKHTIHFIKEQFEKENYQLLSTKYSGTHSKLEYICDRGHSGIISYAHFQSGKRCKQCSIENRSGENSCNWKGGVSELNLPLFDTFAHQIDWCEEVRHDPENNNLLQVKCTNCQKWFTPTSISVRNRIGVLKNIISYDNHFYCSDECKNSCSIYRQRIYPKGFKQDRSREVQPELALMVFERDEHECQRCGNKDGLECHHYESIYSNPIESADIDMCVTLCHKCHKKAHKDIGCRYVDLTKKALCK